MQLHQVSVGGKYRNPRTGMVAIVVGMSRDSEDGVLRVLYKSADGSEDEYPPWDRLMSLFCERFEVAP